MEEKDFEIDVQKFVSEYSNWLNKYKRKLIICTVVYAIILFVNFLIFNNYKVYVGATLLYLFFVIYVSVIGIYVTIKIKKLIK